MRIQYKYTAGNLKVYCNNHIHDNENVPDICMLILLYLHENHIANTTLDITRLQ